MNFWVIFTLLACPLLGMEAGEPPSQEELDSQLVTACLDAAYSHHKAWRFDAQETVTELVKQGANPNAFFTPPKDKGARPGQKYSILGWFGIKEDVGLLGRLLQGRVDLNACVLDPYKIPLSAYEYCIWYDKLDALKRLLCHRGPDPPQIRLVSRTGQLSEAICAFVEAYVPVWAQVRAFLYSEDYRSQDRDHFLDQTLLQILRDAGTSLDVNEVIHASTLAEIEFMRFADV